MTYCCGVLVRDGMVMIADTRTNAGLDNVSTFRKLHVFAKPGERIMAIASAGNLAISQPVLDRAMHYDVELYEALKTSLISMDSTMRSNLGVGLPIDVLVVRTDACEADLNHRIEAGEPYFHDLRSRWSAALRAAHQNIPRPPYKTETETKK